MTPDQVVAAYARGLMQGGITVTLRRYSGSGESRTTTDAANIRARLLGYAPEELVAPVQQGDSRVIVLAQDLADLSWPMPPRRGDAVIVSGKELLVENVDYNTRRIAGVLVAYDMQVRG
ncbi:MAG: hypothetical protein ACK4NA_12830 [Alphaproteobacteria bacterium]